MKSLIDSSEFIAGYSVRDTQPQRLLVRYEDQVETEEKYVSFVDDDTFPQQKFAPTVPLLVELLKDSTIVGSSHGLLCLYGYYRDPGNSRQNSGTEMAVLWNPSIRKSVAIAVPDVLYWPCETVIRFGVCPDTSDPKIVKITHVNMWWEMENTTSIPLLIDVFALSSGSWRSPSSNLPRKSIAFTGSQVVIDRFIYWFALDTIDGGFWGYNLIMSFDIASEEFREVDLPDSLALQPVITLSISKLWVSLAVLEYSIDTEKQVYDVWMMEYGVPKSFTKLFTIKASHASIKTLGFTKNGEPIMEMEDDYEEPAALVVYEPYSEHTNNLGIYGTGHSFFVSSYMETLLLLDQSNCSIYFDIN